MSCSDHSLKEFAQAWDSILECFAEELAVPSKPLPTQSIKAIFDDVQVKDRPSQAALVLENCASFTSEWENSGRISAAVQQLIALLHHPLIQGVLKATKDVACRNYSPLLPEIPYEVDEDEGVAVKVVHLVKRGQPMGATIKKDSKGRVLIARVIAGGVAEKSACIQEGDRVIEVDSGTVRLKLVPANHSHPATNHSYMHLRALIDYDGASDAIHPCPETSLSFNKGDIIELLVATDQHWWQARLLGRGAFAGCEEEADGVLPSASGLSSPKGGVNSLGVGLIPSESLQMERRAGSTKANSRGTIRSKSSLESEEGICYEPVCRLRPRHANFPSRRPIIFIGAPGVGRNELKRRLMNAFPERFSSAVPHTSRPPRSGDVPGVNYHFVKRKEMEEMIKKGEMIEFGEFRSNLYGTSKASILEAMRKAMLILNPHPLALRALRTPKFAPFVIFVRPPSKKEFLETRDAQRQRSLKLSASEEQNRPRAFNEADIDLIIDTTQQIQKAYGAYFDAEIVNKQLEVTLPCLIRLIDILETATTWVPLSWATRNMVEI